jgi:hypothetical protein
MRHYWTGLDDRDTHAARMAANAIHIAGSSSSPDERPRLNGSRARPWSLIFVLDAQEQAIYDRCGEATTGLVHQSDRDTQYLPMRYTDRLADGATVPFGE